VGLPTTTGSPVTDLLLGASFAPYYYVLQITVLVLVTPLFIRLSGGTVAALAVLLPAQWYFAAAVPPDAVHPFWQIRNPLLWWGYFVAGWVVRERRDAIVAWIGARRRAFLATMCAIVAALAIASGVEAPRVAVRSAAWLNVYAILATLFAASCHRSRSSAPVRYLSDATYAIYLLHLFFVYSVARQLHMAPGRADPVVTGTLFAAGLVGSLAVVAAARRLLGPRSRDLIGA
jgi:peptidoglycan/LPS O-acetylase OafA/YrhL